MPLTRSAVLALATALLISCKDSGSSPAAGAMAAGDSAVAPASTSSGDPLAAKAPSPDRTVALKAVVAWNGALDTHDVGALSAMYAPRVRFYGPEIPRSAVIEAKRRALGPASTFHQTIDGDVDVEPMGDGYRARFSKRSGASGKSSVVTAYLGFANADGGRLLISEETDEPSIGRTARGSRDACMSLAADTVNALPEVTKLLADTQKELPKYPDRAMGGIGPMDEGDGVTMGIGVQQPERYEALVWYTVSAAGKLTVTAMGSDVTVPTAKLAAVEKACKK